MKKQKYVVMVDDNFHFTDETERYKQGEYKSCEEAVNVCKEIIEEYLLSAYEPGMTAKQLFASYKMFGEDPYIESETTCNFSAWNHAEERSNVLTVAK